MKRASKLKVNRETIRRLGEPFLRGLVAGVVATPPVSLNAGTACPGSESICICLETTTA